MKSITPIPMWSNGTTTNATILNAYGTHTSLGNFAIFYYQLMDENKRPLVSGEVRMSGEDYQAWDDDSVAWDFIANELNLTITGDYVEPEIIEEI